MNAPHAHDGFTPKGQALGMAAISHELRAHLGTVELHWCSECGALIAHCIVHDSGIHCRSCGVSM